MQSQLLLTTTYHQPTPKNLDGYDDGGKPDVRSTSSFAVAFHRFERAGNTCIYSVRACSRGIPGKVVNVLYDLRSHFFDELFFTFPQSRKYRYSSVFWLPECLWTSYSLFSSYSQGPVGIGAWSKRECHKDMFFMFQPVACCLLNLASATTVDTKCNKVLHEYY